MENDEDFTENCDSRCRCGLYGRMLQLPLLPEKTRRPLAGTEWQLIQLGGKAVKPEEGKFTVTLLAEGNRLTGVGACNRLTGAYKTDGKRTLKIGPLAATMMACPGMDEEEAFTKMLESVTHYDMDGPMLLLLSDGELRAVFQARP